MNLHQLLEGTAERFDKKWNYASFTWNGQNATGKEFAEKTAEELKSFIKQEQLRVLEEVMKEIQDRREGMHGSNFAEGYHQALKDLLDAFGLASLDLNKETN